MQRSHFRHDAERSLAEIPPLPPGGPAQPPVALKGHHRTAALAVDRHARRQPVADRPDERRTEAPLLRPPAHAHRHSAVQGTTLPVRVPPAGPPTLTHTTPPPTTPPP